MRALRAIDEESTECTALDARHRRQDHLAQMRRFIPGSGRRRYSRSALCAASWTNTASAADRTPQAAFHTYNERDRQ